jgi:dTMP kinase
MTELLLMFAARAQHIAAVIKPALDRDEWVICDRFTDATYAYQGAARGMSVDLIRQLENIVQGDLQPHQVILLDLPPEVGLERARSRGALDRFERESIIFYERVRSGYLARARDFPDRYTVIDAEQDLIGVERQLETLVQKWFSK